MVTIASLQSQWDGNGGNLSREQIYGILSGLMGVDRAAYEVYGSGKFPDKPQGQVLGNTTYDPYGGGGTSGGGTAPEAPVGPTPEQLAAALESHNRNVKSINDAYSAGLLGFDEKEAMIGRNRNELVKSRDEGYSDNSAYFNNVSPDAFQSQIGNYNTKVLDAYTQGDTDLNNEATKLQFAKGQFGTQKDNEMWNENQFNAGTGQYDSGGTGYQGTLTANVPQLAQINTGAPRAGSAKLGGGTQTSRYAPNYQPKNEQDPLYKFLNS